MEVNTIYNMDIKCIQKRHPQCLEKIAPSYEIVK